MWCLTYQAADGKAKDSELQKHKNSFKKKENRFMRDISCVIRNTWKVLKCGAGERWRRSVEPIT